MANYELYHLYEVIGEAALAKRQAYRELTKQKAANAKAWAESHGGIKALSRGQFCCGIVTPVGSKPNGPGWEQGDEQPNAAETRWYYNWRTKAGRAIERAINSNDLRQGTSIGLARALGITVSFIDSASRMMDAQAFDVGDRVMLIVPKRMPGEPAPEIDGCRSLKLSEFYAIKEQVEPPVAV